MMQFSVYVRHCPSKENMEVHVKRVRLALPTAGQVSILAVTDKQYSEIRNYLGAVEKAKPEVPQQLELFQLSEILNNKIRINITSLAVIVVEFLMEYHAKCLTISKKKDQGCGLMQKQNELQPMADAAERKAVVV